MENTHSDSKVTSSVLGVGAGPSREYCDRGTDPVSQAGQEDRATDELTTQTRTMETNKDMNSDIDGNSPVGEGTERKNNVFEEEYVDLDISSIFDQGFEDKDIYGRYDSIFVARLPDEERAQYEEGRKRKRARASTPELGESSEGLNLDSVTKVEKQLQKKVEELQQFCDDHKNVHQPVKKLAFEISRLEKQIRKEMKILNVEGETYNINNISGLREKIKK
ncbi:hypothetical protein WA026_018379 [Henosepilachna vigintioctopunctata]|uniref:Uncharacterized protein n=1 Tax=Henosepilachna vigintioctopunctata TaxID=420089 RepID=A0AAW1V1S3_9CUCU